MAWSPRASIFAAIVTAGGCATHHTVAPAARTSPLVIRGLQLYNATPVSEPRIYFSDGITKYTTDYRGWTQSVIDAYGAALDASPTPPSSREVSFSILGINCAGHYIADCSMSLQIEHAGSPARVLNTATVNGWPISSALQKTLDAGVALALADASLNDFVGRPAMNKH